MSMSPASVSAANALLASCGNGAASSAVSSFGSALFERQAALAATTNLIISPLSVYLALVLALNAAGTGTQTQAELLRALCAASQVGASGYASLAPGPLPAAEAAKVEAAVNADIAALARQLATTPAASTSSSARPGGTKGAPSASGGSGNPQNAAAKNTGTTATAPGGPELLLANSLWTQKGPTGAKVTPEYAARMASLLSAVAKQGDAADVNAWAAQATKGLIDQAIAPGTRFDMLLANAVYFKGSWERAFSKDDTAEWDFNALKTVANKAGAAAATTTTTTTQPQLAFSPKKVQMMSLRVKAADDRNAVRQGQRSALTLLTPKFVAARLPYRGGRQSAVLVLPTDKAPGALQELLLKGGSGGGRFDWRRDLALDGPVPSAWAKAVSEATGKSVDDLTNPFGGGGGAKQAPVPLPPTRGGGGKDDDGRPISLPRVISPTLPGDPDAWMPPSVRSTGGLVLRMPKFRAETKQLKLKDALTGPLGLSSAFDASSANFSRATVGSERLAVDDVIHSAVVIVDEEGTEAAAVTAVVMMRTAMPMREEDPPIEIVLDRPFLFAVVDDSTGLPMFTGSVTDPVWREG